jgi:hypothetical protein
LTAGVVNFPYDAVREEVAPSIDTMTKFWWVFLGRRAVAKGRSETRQPNPIKESGYNFPSAFGSDLSFE